MLLTHTPHIFFDIQTFIFPYFLLKGNFLISLFLDQNYLIRKCKIGGNMHKFRYERRRRMLMRIY